MELVIGDNEWTLSFTNEWSVDKWLITLAYEKASSLWTGDPIISSNLKASLAKAGLGQARWISILRFLVGES